MDDNVVCGAPLQFVYCDVREGDTLLMTLRHVVHWAIAGKLPYVPPHFIYFYRPRGILSNSRQIALCLSTNLD